MPKVTLFDDIDENKKHEVDTLKINKSYANAYRRWRTAEEVQAGRLTAEDLESTDSESSEDEYTNADNPEFDKDFFKVLGALESKDPILKESTASFWKDTYAQPKAKKKTEKIVSIRDMEKEKILKKLEKDDLDGEEEDEYEEIEEKHGRKFLGSTDTNSKPSTSFGFCDDELSDNEEMFTRKPQTYREEEPEDHEKEIVYDYLKGKKNKLDAKIEDPLLKNLKNVWSRKNMSEEDKFLQEHVLNRRFLEEDDDPDDINFHNVEEDEAIFDEHEEIATKYNFRFEEPDSDVLKTFPRKIENTLRVQENKRKEERERIKQKKKEATERKKQELMQLRAEKKKELLERQQKIFEAAGMEYDLGNELDQEFDPDKYDEYMAQKFNEAYDNNTEMEKPKLYDSDFEDEGGQYDYDGYEQYGNQGDAYEYDGQYDEEDYDNQAHDQKVEDYLDQKFGFSHIAGDTLVRFQYVQTEANDYGLTAQEIIDATTSDLNSWVSMKKIRKHDITKEEEEKARKAYSKKGRNMKIKKKVLPSIFGDVEKNHEEDQEKRRLKNLKKKERKQRAALRKARLENKIRIETEIEERRNRRMQEPTQSPAEKTVSISPKKTSVPIPEIKPIETKNEIKEKQDKPPHPVKNKKRKADKMDSFKSSDGPVHKKHKNNPKKHNKQKSSANGVGKVSDLRLQGFNLDPKKFKKKAKYGMNPKK